MTLIRASSARLLSSTPSLSCANFHRNFWGRRKVCRYTTSRRDWHSTNTRGLISSNDGGFFVAKAAISSIENCDDNNAVTSDILSVQKHVSIFNSPVTNDDLTLKQYKVWSGGEGSATGTETRTNCGTLYHKRNISPELDIPNSINGLFMEAFNYVVEERNEKLQYCRRGPLRYGIYKIKYRNQHESYRCGNGARFYERIPDFNKHLSKRIQVRLISSGKKHGLGPSLSSQPTRDSDGLKENAEETESSRDSDIDIHNFSPTQRTDKEFADYLTGETDSRYDAPTSNAAAATTTSTKPLDSFLSSSSSSMSPLSSSLTESHTNSNSSNQEATKTELSSTSNFDSQSHSTSNAQTSATGDEQWLNTLHQHQSVLGRPTPSDDTYKNIHRDQISNHEKARLRQVVTVRRALAGNLVITAFKLAATLHSGSSAMMSEFIHSVVDCGNQSLLLIGLRDAGLSADRSHPYGYGKSIYFWALVSALGTFFLGAGVSMTQALPELIHGPSIHEITWHVWGVLGISFAVDGYVLTKTILEVKEFKPDNGMSLWKYVWTIRDPATLAILLEDGAACLGILIATGGIVLTHATDMPVFDALAGVGISGLLAAMGLVLVRVNHRFLLGQAVDPEIIKGIEKILLNRRSIDNVHSVQSQWNGPETFSYKAEVDFDGTFLAAKLMPRYQKEFSEARATLDQDLRVLLSWYAEDVMRTVEREVKHIEAEIKKEYPGAQYIELEPMSKDADRFAIDDGMEAQLKRIEIEALNRYLKSLYQMEVSKSKRKKNPDDDTTPKTKEVKTDSNDSEK